MNHYGVFTYPRKPPLKHDLHQPIVLLIGRGRGLSERERRDDSLGVVVNDGVVELLKLIVRA